MNENYKKAFELLKSRWDEFVEEREEYLKKGNFSSPDEPENIYKVFKRYLECTNN